MRLSAALLADAANVSREGKLNILGVYQIINAVEVPIQQPQLSLVMILESEPREYDMAHTMDLTLKDPDGAEIHPLPSIPFTINASSRPREGNVLLNIVGLTFPKFGVYRFDISVDGISLGYIPLIVQPQQVEDSNVA